MMPSRNPRNLQWKESALNGDGFSDYRFQETQGHVFYSIFGEPLPPWKANPLGDNQNAWTNALEFAIVKTNAKGASTETNALAMVTQYLFSGHGLVYDTSKGVSSYTTKMAGYFKASQYMNKSATSDIYGNARNGKIVNCYDQAAALTCFGRLLGVGVQYRLQAPFGCLNPIHVVGPIYTNNPFFDSVGTLPLVGLDEARTRFGNHAFSTFNEMVFDACAGPAKGSQSVGGYLADTIDRSTNWELRIAAPPTAIPVTNTFSRIF